MPNTLDVGYVVGQINGHLISMEFVPRDADGSDFQYGDDTSLRFKTGTSRGEVAVQVWRTGYPVEVIRIYNPEGAVEVMHRIDAIIHKHRNPAEQPGVDEFGRSGGMLGH